MTFLADVLKGIFIGIANVIPGVSGGTMAVSFGIYDKLIGAVSNLFKDWKKSTLTLLPIVIGCGIGLAGFTYAVEYLLSNHTFITCMAFVGLILGGLPIIVQTMQKKKKALGASIGISGILAFIFFFGISVILPILNQDQQSLQSLTVSPGMMITLFFLGVIASATMIIPGVSGSMVLMILGYYYGILKSVKTFLQALSSFNISGMMQEFWLLFPFGIGVLLGIFLIAKLITFLFEKYSIPTYCAILGLIASSPIAILYNTGVLSELSGLSLPNVLIGLLAFLAGSVLTYKIGGEE